MFFPARSNETKGPANSRLAMAEFSLSDNVREWRSKRLARVVGPEFGTVYLFS